jgi:uncharacterized protein YkwD
MNRKGATASIAAFRCVIPCCAAILGVAVTAPLPASAGPVAGAKSCGGYVNVAPSKLKGGGGGMVGNAQTLKQLNDFQAAVACLINAERTTRGLPALTRNKSLDKAAIGHTSEAQRLKWWVPGADPHTNPETRSTVSSRIKAAGYCPTPIWVSEIAYTAAGLGGGATPLGAVNWWMNISTSGHREAILEQKIKELGVGFSGQVANRTVPAQPDMGTYVVNFGACPQTVAPRRARPSTRPLDDLGILKKPPPGFNPSR